MTKNELSTHRVIQLSVLQDTLQASINVHWRCSAKLASIGNRNGAAYYSRKAEREEILLSRVNRRLAS